MTAALNEMCSIIQLLQGILRLNVAYLPVHSIYPDTEKIDPQEFCWALRGMPCIGGAISRDIKQAVIPFLDELDDSAREINSVNTVIRQGKLLKGYNTDALGFLTALQSGLGHQLDKISSIVCYGYGGVTNVAVYVLKSLGKTVYITGRRSDMAEQKAEELGVRLWSADVQADMFVNAAPVSDQPLENATMFLEALHGCRFAFDHEMPGKYLAEYCDQHEIQLIRGTEMYKPQMLAQWSLFLKGFVEPSQLMDALTRCGI